MSTSIYPMRRARVIEIGGGAAALLQVIQMFGTDSARLFTVNFPLFAVCLVVVWAAHTRRWRDARSLMGIGMMLAGAVLFSVGARVYFKPSADTVLPQSPKQEVAQAQPEKPTPPPRKDETPVHVESHDQSGGVNANYGTVNQYAQPQTPARKDHSAEIAHLSGFIDEGELIRKQFMKSKDTPAIEAARSAWINRVADYLKNIDGGSYVSDFTTTRASAWEGSPSGYSINGGGAYMDIGAKQRALTKIKDDLRGRS